MAPKTILKLQEIQARQGMDKQQSHIARKNAKKSSMKSYGIKPTDDNVDGDDFVNTNPGIMERFVSDMNDRLQNMERSLAHTFFPGLPAQYSLRKRLMIQRSIAQVWVIWDTIHIILIFASCSLYIITVYKLDYEANRTAVLMEVAITAFYVLDFLLNWCIQSTVRFLTDYMVYVDIVSMLPVFIMLFAKLNPLLDFLKCLRVLRLIRILKYYKVMHELSGVRREAVYLSLTLFIMIFLSSSFTQFLENNTRPMQQQSCSYISANTNWEPSCDPNLPADTACHEICMDDSCEAKYSYLDMVGRPSTVRCQPLSFFNAFYYIIITLSTIGYGDVKLQSNYARASNIVFIFVSLVLIPMRLSDLQVLLSLKNPYSVPYKAQGNESHIVLTGYIQDKQKLETFMKEFFHPDRKNVEDGECHVVILAPNSPSEEIRALLFSNATLESKVSWVIGSPLSINDLKKVKADRAMAMFFLVSTDLHEVQARVGDASNVLAALSVTNYNSTLISFVQVLRPENGDILKDSDVDMILCLDEYKTAVQARNSICPGFSTFIENIFHSMGKVAPEIEERLPPWYDDYLHGAGMELYFVHLPEMFIESMRYRFRQIVEVIYLEWEVIVLGMCKKDRTNVVFNPLRKDLHEFTDIYDFYEQFDTALVMASDQHQADQIERELQRPSVIYNLIMKATEVEESSPCYNMEEKLNQQKQADAEALKALKKSQVDSDSSKLGTNDVRHIQGLAKFKSGVNKFKKAAQTVTKLVAADDSNFSRRADKRFHLPAVRDIKSDHGIHMDDTVMKLAGRSFNNVKIAAALQVDDSYGELESDNDEDDEENQDGDDANYIGYRKKHMPQEYYDTIGMSSYRAQIALNKLKMEKANNKDGEDVCPAYTEEYEGRDEEVPEDNTAQAPHTQHEVQQGDESESGDDDAFNGDEENYQRDSGMAAGMAALFIDKIGGLESAIITDASEMTNHIIVITAETNMLMFVQELRRPCIVGDAYHPILIVHPERPSVWNYISETYNDVNLLIGHPSKVNIIKRMGLTGAFSVAIMGNRESTTRVDGQVVNTGTLFTYLKAENYVKQNCFLTVELSSANNMSVLNATIVRRHREMIGKLVAGTRARGDTLVKTNSSQSPLFMSSPVRSPSAGNLHGGMTQAQLKDLQNNSMRTPTKGINSGEIQAHRRHTALFEDMHGRFATKRSAKDEENKVSEKKQQNITPLTPSPGTRRGSLENKRRGSLSQAFDVLKSKVAQIIETAEDVILTHIDTDLDEFWDAMDSYHVLPVFASAKAFVPSSFESLLVQSFFVKLTPVICEKFVCGQLAQTMMCIELPKDLVDKRWVDLFRVFIAHQVLPMGLYRAARPQSGSILPYVYTSPPKNVILYKGDRVYVFGTNQNVQRAKLGVSHIRCWGNTRAKK